MADPLRERRPLRELAANRQVIEIAAKISDFERLVEVVGEDLSRLPAAEIPQDWQHAEVTGRLAFESGDAQGGMPLLHLALAVRVPAQCQRCLQAFELPLETVLDIAFATPGQAVAEQGEREVWEWHEERPRPLDIAEEALIMAMPLSAKHEGSEDCVEIEAADEPQQTTTPFASLRAQMDDYD